MLIKNPRDAASRQAIRDRYVVEATERVRNEALLFGRSIKCQQIRDLTDPKAGYHANEPGGCRNDGSTCICECHDTDDGAPQTTPTPPTSDIAIAIVDLTLVRKDGRTRNYRFELDDKDRPIEMDFRASVAVNLDITEPVVDLYRRVEEVDRRTVSLTIAGSGPNGNAHA